MTGDLRPIHPVQSYSGWGVYLNAVEVRRRFWLHHPHVKPEYRATMMVRGVRS